MGALLLCAGEKGRRYALSNARIMIHQPLGGARGQATDIEIQAREIRHMKANVQHSGEYFTAAPCDPVHVAWEPRDLHVFRDTGDPFDAGLGDE